MLNTKELKEIILDLTEVAKESNLRISDDILFEQASTFYRGYLMNQNRTISKGQVTTPAPTQEIKLCSPKQVAYALKLSDALGVDIKLSEKNTSQEVSKLIQDLKDEMSKRNQI